MPPLLRPRAQIFPAALAFAVGLALPLRAQTTVTLSDGQTSSTAYDTTSAPNHPLTFTVANSDTATQSGILSGTGSVIKNGTGTLTLTAANTFTGSAIVNAGTLQLDDPGELSGNGALVVNNGGTFALGAVSKIIGSLAGTGLVDLGSDPGRTLTVGADHTSTVFSGTIFGVGASLTKIGTGTLTLTGPTNYNGNTTVTGGTLEFDGPDAVLNGRSTSGVSDDPGTTLTINGGVLRLVSGVSTAGTLVGSGGIVDIAGSVLTLNGGFDLIHPGIPIFSGVIQGNGGSILKDGFGTQTLTGNNTYTGSTTVTHGTLILSQGSLASDIIIAGGTMKIGNSTFTGNVTVGAGEFIVQDSSSTGGITLASSMIIATGGTVAFSGTISGPGAPAVGALGTATVTLSGANTYSGATVIANNSTLVAGAANTLSSNSTIQFNSSGIVSLNGFSQSIAGLTQDSLAHLGSVTLGSATLTIGANSASSSYYGQITGAGALIKAGSGTLTLGGNNTFSGGTTLSAGTLIVNGSLANTAVAIANGATLGGSGTIGGLTTLANGAHLAPGNSPGTLTFTNGLTLTAGAILDFQLGTTSDLVRVSGGTLSGPLSGLVTLNLSDAGGFGAGTYTLFDFTSAATSSFDPADFTLGTSLSGYIYNLALNGSSLQLTTTVSAIPEPATYTALFGLAGLSLAILRRRKLRT